MNKEALTAIIKQKRSFLCVGLDPDLNKLPQHLTGTGDPIFEFNKQIIDATHDLAAAYKPNLAFYESLGIKGLQSFEKTIHYIQDNLKDEVFTIADAKRGDIGNTSAQYAKAFLSQDGYGFDAITVAPYMGADSVTPFLSVAGKWVILLALTSNSGAQDFQYFRDATGKNLFEVVLEKSSAWGNDQNMMFVVGATKAEKLEHIRSIIPDHFLLVPGIGAQGGSLQDVAKFGMNHECGLLVNASRSILYASNGTDFATKARQEALHMKTEMDTLLKEAGL